MCVSVVIILVGVVVVVMNGSVGDVGLCVMILSGVVRLGL